MDAFLAYSYQHLWCFASYIRRFSIAIQAGIMACEVVVDEFDSLRCSYLAALPRTSNQ